MLVYANASKEAINSTAHQQVNLEAALQSIVLLKNSGVLPLRRGLRLAVVGPHAYSQRDLIEDYAGDQRVMLGRVFIFYSWNNFGRI